MAGFNIGDPLAKVDTRTLAQILPAGKLQGMTSSTPYSVKEFAAIVKKHPDTVRKWCRNGNVRAKKIGKDFLIYTDPKEY